MVIVLPGSSVMLEAKDAAVSMHSGWWHLEAIPAHPKPVWWNSQQKWVYVTVTAYSDLTPPPSILTIMLAFEA